MVNVLDSGNLAAVGTLLTAIAFGAREIDTWLLEQYGADRGTRFTETTAQSAAGTPSLSPGTVPPAAAGSDALARVTTPDTSMTRRSRR